MALPRFTETTTKRVAYTLTVFWGVVVVVGLFETVFAILAGAVGFPAGIWMGRLTEARESAKGNGVIIGQ